MSNRHLNTFLVSFVCMLAALTGVIQAAADDLLRAGASAVDISPQVLPVIRNGGMIEGTSDRIDDPIYARCIVLAKGSTRIAIVIVDSCMIPEELCDQIKSLAEKETGIPTDRIAISATHTHSAPSVMDYCLGSRSDPVYTKYLPGKIVESIAAASVNLQPAEVGSGRIDAGEFTKCRRWIFRPDKIQADPFGDLTVRANMHPGPLSPNAVGPSGPVDPWLSVLSVRTKDHKPIALLANFSMHYFGGHPGISADYFGMFARRIHEKLAPQNADFVGMMSQGTSGDLWWGDYFQPTRVNREIDSFTNSLVDLAMQTYETIHHTTDAEIAMAERRVTMQRRQHDEQHLAWAERMVKLMGDRRPKDQPEVYAEQAIYLKNNPECEVVLQAIRIGDLGIATFPNEVYGLTGLKIKLQSPLAMNFNLELANGASGYIPPPEQHKLGGYNTWPSRTAGLEVEAEPKMVEILLELLEKVAGKSRREFREADCPYTEAVLASKPTAYYRMAELAGSQLRESVAGYTANLEGNVAFHLAGPAFAEFPKDETNRSIQFIGAKMPLPKEIATNTKCVEFYFWNGMVSDARDITATLFSNGSDQLVLTGTADAEPGHLLLGETRGATKLERYTWYHVAIVQGDNKTIVYLNGNEELTSELRLLGQATLTVGGCDDNQANLEGRIDEVATYDRPLTDKEIAKHVDSAGIETTANHN